LGIITNATPSRKEIELRKTGLDKYFDPVIVSSVVHSRKPESKIYKIALKMAGVKPQKLLLLTIV